MAGSGIGKGASEEVLEDTKMLSGGDLRCGTTMVCALLYVGECLWINPSVFYMRAYCSCKMTLVREALRLPSELAGDRGSSGMVTSNGGQWLGTVG